ncbi:hypothetical protein [Corallococcus exiguus]|uniref:Uncharacterized protein n=1 Tax=Corallococcus exiguus TaxID=83462 RepID=A0A7X5BTY8_9BACT|nr:hypothetical protein [Corallococcus exiguus]NBC40667.1 hypothetical protein [Corallococcus exiguus]TNV59214.1 hypothetical protein FH620_26990 [Corallococcus exiguus]
MSGPSRKSLLTNVLCLGALGWIYGGDLSDALRARTEEVSALLTPPSAVRASIVLGLAGAGLVVFLAGLLRKKPEGFKGYRLLPILLVVALFVDLVLAESRTPLDPPEMASVALQRFQGEAQKLATVESVPTRSQVLQPLVDALGSPPYLERGASVPAYTLQVRTDCEGPVRDAPGARAGTLLYCVARDGKQAWVTLVGLPAEVRFGAPAVLSQRGEPRVAVVRAQIPADPEENDVLPGIDLEIPTLDGGSVTSPSP